MIDIFYLIVGTLILLLVMYDFFFTTLSGSGSAFITRFLSLISYRILQVGVKLIGRRVFALSGMIVNLIVLSGWVVLVWIGLFMLFSYTPEAIVNDNGKIANATERIYFTGYTLSTLGLGNFKPVSPFYEILTSCFSFFGFVFFTTSMTYLVSVSSAVIHKRSLALSIRNLGNSPEEIVNNLLEKDTSFCYQKFSVLQEMIDRHTVNHQAYPVLHYYGNADISSSFNLHLASLDEAISKLLSSLQAQKFHNELMPLRSSLTHFLKHMQQNYPQTIKQFNISQDNLPEIGEMSVEFPENHIKLYERRKILGGLLRNENFVWEDVYSN
ncbi:hypothetical protein JKA74_03310 [Marivirga sp. S37H4]|uniref:Potassium channel domain-containing protein n=1 Tax=Marivirga aurantiaca TaxID=2802615 RepID=A0A935C5X3_9BACT|nr:ion channel [Marivirga aurantiaca]MBK6264054.1 hypothetical protein [Marivirga aurantiaca]